MTSYQQHTDEQLIQLLRNGDEQAFTEIYQRYYKVLYHYIAGFVKTPSLTEDLVQEVLMKIWEMRGRIQVKTSFPAYLYRICHNKTIDALNKITADQSLREESIRWMQAVPDVKENDWKHYEELLNEAIAALPAQRKKIFVLCRLGDKTYKQAAAELGISRNTVKEHMVLALRFIRNYFYERGAFLMAIFWLIKYF